MAFHFVNEPNDDFFCPVCTNLLTEPFLTRCGHYICRMCRDRLLHTSQGSCPSCRESDMLKSARINKYFQRKVNSLQVRCCNYKEGCIWVGEINYLHDHLEQRCCIACPYCNKYIQRRKIEDHMKHHCLRRPTTCDYCGYHNMRDIVSENHYPVCLQFPIHCPNNCTVKKLERCQLQQHLKECPLQQVECPCSNTGCSVQLLRREMAAHTLQQHNHVLEQITNQAVAITPHPDTVSPQYLYNLPPVVFTITDFLEKKQADKVWTSPPYYTHTRGYKSCLKVYPNGDGSGKGTHISVYACLMRGEYDSELEWPFEGAVSVQLCNWREEKNHLRENFGRETFCAIKEETAIVYGNPEFITHTDLTHNTTTNTQYLFGNCLQLKVKCSTTLIIPSWQNPLTTNQSVCEFTLNEYSKHKQFNSQYASPPFYTHPQGYKLFLRVYANGYSRGKGTHVSISACLMRGEHDQHLQWPFSAEFVIELLNWKEDKQHHIVILSIDVNSCFNRVTEGIFGMSCGIPQFIKHSSLPYNTTNNTEYLYKDCLRLGVRDVNVYSTSFQHIIPSWQLQNTAKSVMRGEFTLTEFSKHKQLNNQNISPPFYTHKQGYKLCLFVYANGYGSGEGTHVSVSSCLMKGNHDQHLQWPFKGRVIIELLNWREDKGHHRNFLCYEAQQVTDGIYGMSLCLPNFISHRSLYASFSPYISNDCLRLRVIVAQLR